jgi:hypothetical protein
MTFIFDTAQNRVLKVVNGMAHDDVAGHSFLFSSDDFFKENFIEITQHSYYVILQHLEFLNLTPEELATNYTSLWITTINSELQKYTI